MQRKDHMKSEERLEALVKLIDQHGFLTVQELSKFCQASAMTIRRDLAYLHAENRLRRTHGGAASLKSAEKESEDSRLIEPDSR